VVGSLFHTGETVCGINKRNKIWLMYPSITLAKIHCVLLTLGRSFNISPLTFQHLFVLCFRNASNTCD